MIRAGAQALSKQTRAGSSRGVHIFFSGGRMGADIWGQGEGHPAPPGRATAARLRAQAEAARGQLLCCPVARPSPWASVASMRNGCLELLSSFPPPLRLPLHLPVPARSDQIARTMHTSPMTHPPAAAIPDTKYWLLVQTPAPSSAHPLCISQTPPSPASHRQQYPVIRTDKPL